MRHKSVAISFENLFNRIDLDTDTPIDEVLEIETDSERDDIPEEVYSDKSYGDELFGPVTHSELKGKWFSVQWPEHVTTPRFNSDAYYSAPCTKEEAIESSDTQYI